MMRNNYIRFLLFINILILPIFAINTNTISQQIAKPLFELDKESLDKILLPYTLDNNNIKNIKIIDLAYDEVYWSYSKNQDKSLTCEDKNLKSQFINYEGNQIGKIVVCLSEVLAVQDIQLNLTQEEENWLKEKKNLRFSGDSNWLPYQGYNQNNEFVGFVSEYLKRFEKAVNINVDKIKTINKNELLSLANKKNIDIISGDINDEKLNKNYKPIKPYLSSEIVIVMNDSAPYIETLRTIANKKIAILKNVAYENLILKKYPNIKFYQIDNVDEGINGVLSNKFDAMIGSLGLMSYTIKSNSLNNLRIVGSTNVKMYLTFFVKKDEEILFNVLEKFMNSIDEPEHYEIRSKYSQLELKTVVDYRTIWYVILIALVLLGAFIYHNRRLHVQMERAERFNKELQFEKEHVEELNKELKVSKLKAENVAKQKSEFLANMSHEIRTPMNSIIGFTDILEKELQNPVHQEYLDSIKKGGHSLLRIINDILDLSKIEAGKLEIRNESINPTALFLEIESIFHSKIISKNINFELDIDKTLPQYIITDSVRLRQILFNIIGNAIKFTEKGFIRLKVENQYKDDIKSKLDLIFSVEDSGIGIDEKNLQSIFNSFEQQENQDVAKYGGTGLGLAICNKLTNMMNGKIEVTSKKGEGTKFTVKLFDVDVSSLKEEEQVSKVNSSKIVFEKASILVVDDVEENRKLIQAALKDYSFELIMAKDGKEAIDKLRTINVDLILMDLRMPVMDGYEAVRIIKDDKVLSKTPVIALTASVMGKDLEKVSQFGFDGYLRKPVIINDLIVELCNFLKHSQSEVTIDDESLDSYDYSDLKELIEHLENNKVKWIEAKDSGDFTLIEEFAHILMDLSNKYKVQMIKNYSSELLNSVDSFDIEKIEFVMNTYLDLIENIKQKV